MIEVKNVTKKYGKHIALDNLNLTIEHGKIYGLLGENGAGKSTTMNIITGYLAPTTGDVVVDEYDILKDANKAKAKIGYLPELPPLYQDMTVKEYLSFVAQLKGIARKNRKQAVADALEKAGIADVQKRLIKNLSKGYKQRVGIAQAIIGSPEIVILDEPTVGLDPVQIMEIRELIREIGKEHTVILSSHILSEISEVCDHVFMISDGKLVLSKDMSEIDSLEEVFIKHTHSEGATEEPEEPDESEETSSVEEKEPEKSEEKKLSREEKRQEKKQAKEERKEEKLRKKEEKQSYRHLSKEEKEKAKRQARIEKRREARRKKKNENKEEK